ncbi:MAG: alpha/beta hydrolase [Rudaea sp.]
MALRRNDNRLCRVLLLFGRPSSKAAIHPEGVGKVRKQPSHFTAALRSASLLLIVTILTACGGGSGLNKDPQDAIGSVVAASIQSAKTGAVYPLYIYLPASYAKGAGTYPVIYATDGDAAFPPAGRFVNFTRILQREGIDAILVGIGGTARRSKDYVLPGAVAYHEFITRELIPSIESKFRADPKRRILSGISLGGSFVVTSLFLEAPDRLSFSYYISVDGSFFQPSFLALEQTFSSAMGTQSIPVTLILARAGPSYEMPHPTTGNGANIVSATANLSRGLGDFTNSAEVDSLYHRMVNRHYVDLILIETSFNTGHIQTDNPSFEDAMTRIFK